MQLHKTVNGKTLVLAFLVAAAGCNSSSTQKDFSTVDSNTVVPGDSAPAILYLDSNLTDTSIAMDSAGRMITPKDTAYSKSK